MTDQERIEQLEAKVERLERQIVEIQRAAANAAIGMDARIQAQMNTEPSLFDGLFP